MTIGLPTGWHLPDRPQWNCDRCRGPWPCAGARVHLRTRFGDDTAALSNYLSTQLFIAAADLGQLELPAELVNRFLSWVLDANG